MDGKTSYWGVKRLQSSRTQPSCRWERCTDLIPAHQPPVSEVLLNIPWRWVCYAVQVATTYIRVGSEHTARSGFVQWCSAVPAAPRGQHQPGPDPHRKLLLSAGLCRAQREQEVQKYLCCQALAMTPLKLLDTLITTSIFLPWLILDEVLQCKGRCWMPLRGDLPLTPGGTVHPCTKSISLPWKQRLEPEPWSLRDAGPIATTVLYHVVQVVETSLVWSTLIPLGLNQQRARTREQVTPITCWATSSHPHFQRLFQSLACCFPVH